MERRLAAIMSADVVGYSRLIREDEDATLDGLKALRRGVIDPALAARGGRIVKVMGDGLLVEFSSAVEAVRAAAEIQQAMSDRPSEAGIAFRIGINIGDIVVEETDIHGDGVNVAARLEAEAPPGGLCIAGAVHEQVRDRIEFTFVDVGQIDLKNIDRPVRAWHWQPEQEQQTGTSEPESTSILQIQGKPTVAVLPFNVFGGGDEVEFLADGMVEDIITALSKVPDLLVTARNSTFVYKGKAVDIRRVGREQGVRYVLEGSVRQLGGRVRVTAQLIDAETGAHIWADTYDGSTDDVFELIDGIARSILEALEVQLTAGEQARSYFKGTWTIRAYENFRNGRAAYLRFTRRDNAEAREHVLAAIQDSPGWPAPYVILGWTYVDEARWGWTDNREESLTAGIAAFRRAVERDAELDLAYGGRGYGKMLAGEFDEALDLARKCVALGPSSGDGLHVAAMIASFCGCPEEALGFAKHAMRVVPVPQSNILTELGQAHLLVGEPRRAIAPLRHALAISPFWASARCLLIWALDAMGDPDGARAAATELMSAAPRFRLTRWAPSQPYRDPSLLEGQLDALRRAGIPD